MGIRDKRKRVIEDRRKVSQFKETYGEMEIPSSERYCLHCKKLTLFKLVKEFQHSRCVVCDGYKCRKKR